MNDATQQTYDNFFPSGEIYVCGHCGDKIQSACERCAWRKDITLDMLIGSPESLLVCPHCSQRPLELHYFRTDGSGEMPDVSGSWMYMDQCMWCHKSPYKWQRDELAKRVVALETLLEQLAQDD